MRFSRFRRFLAASLLLAAGPHPALGHTASPAAEPGRDGAALIYRKIFKSSFPEFVEIRVEESGAATWDIRQLDEEASPQPFEIGRPLAQKLFELATQLHNFSGIELDVHRRIANLGQKTFRFEKGTESHEVTFNYTINSAAGQLLEIFDGLARQQEDLSTLERAMKYERLGVNDALVRLETDFSAKHFPEPERLLPTLDQLASDIRFLDMARQRARSLAERIRHPQ